MTVAQEEEKRARVTRYDVETATDSISDLRLQIVEALDELEQNKSSSSSSRRPARPIWFRERLLTPRDEIVDRLVDAKTAHVTWTIHRPVRGWYLHLRSPLLPPGSAIPLRPSRTAAADPSSTPLTFTIGTTVNYTALRDTRPFLDDNEPIHSPSSAYTSRQEHFTSINLDQTAPLPHHQNLSRPRSPPQAIEAPSPQINEGGFSTAREIHAEPGNGGSGTAGGHTRRRSAGVSSNTAHPGSRHVSRSSQLEGVSTPSVVVEEAEESLGEAGASHPLQHDHRPLNVDSDSPYSPNGPSPLLRNDLPRNGDVHSGLQPPQRSSAKRTFSKIGNKPRNCNFLLTDGSGAFSLSWKMEAQAAPGRKVEPRSRLGWAKWAWSLMPEPIRPPLALDTSKTFSLRWLDPPLMHRQRSPSPSAPGSFREGDLQPPSSSPLSSASNRNTSPGRRNEEGMGIEVLRFEDNSGWWFWKARRKGQIVVQKNAIKALGLDLGFWIALALAYLEFLEERDGYNAAIDG